MLKYVESLDGILWDTYARIEKKDDQLFESHSFTNSNLGEIKTLEIYQNALEFINNKFTKESSTEFKIEDYWYNHITITIKKSRNKGGGISDGIFNMITYL